MISDRIKLLLLHVFTFYFYNLRDFDFSKAYFFIFRAFLLKRDERISHYV